MLHPGRRRGLSGAELGDDTVRESDRAGDRK